MERIKSFEVDHDFITPGFYISRIDGDVTTYDLRTRRPNCNDLMCHGTMHTFEHLFATYIRNSALSADILYFGPMGCQTGFYLLVRNADNEVVLEEVKKTCERILAHEGEVFGKASRECGNYRNLSLENAKKEAARYLAELNSRKQTFIYEE
jgi:S-ribosylhomocysteine lyase